MAVNTPKGYAIPTTVDPGSNLCIRVYVPNDPLYVGAFWNAYEFFTKWNAWERDSAHTGADVAAVWRAAFVQARDEWLLGAGVCCPYQNTQTEPFDELLDLLWGVNTIIVSIDNWLDDGYTAAQIKVFLANHIYHFPGIDGVVDTMAATDPAVRQAAINAFDWEAAVHGVWCNAPCDLSELIGPAHLIDWSWCAISTFLTYLADLTDDFSEWVIACFDGVVDRTPFPWLAGLTPNGGTNFAIDPFLCPFDHDWDFTVDDGSWVGDWLAGFGGHWGSGQGWLPDVRQQPDDNQWRRSYWLYRDFDQRYITSVKVNVSLTKGNINSTGASGFIIRGFLGETQVAYVSRSFAQLSNGTWDYTLSFECECDRIEVYTACSRYPTEVGASTGSVVLNTTEVLGMGDDPF